MHVSSDPNVVFDESTWDELVDRSRTNSVFVSRRWLRSSHSCYDQNHEFIGAWVLDAGGRRVGQAAFLHESGCVKFMGQGPSDYLDIIVSDSLTEAESRDVKSSILNEVSCKIGQFRQYTLSNIVERANPPDLQNGHWEGWHVVPLHRMSAPFVSHASLGRLATRSSLRRVESRLRRVGKLTFATYREAQDVVPRLDSFFDLHVRRWSSTDCPSLFLQECHRRFFHRIAEVLDETGIVRFTEVKLDDRLIASHFGFRSADKFVWYKPAFEPELSDYSPGVALLGELARQAINEGATEFDFTIGAEPFKYRYADGERQVSKFLLTKSPLSALAYRASLGGRRWILATAKRLGLKRKS